MLFSTETRKQRIFVRQVTPFVLQPFLYLIILSEKEYRNEGYDRSRTRPRNPPELCLVVYALLVTLGAHGVVLRMVSIPEANEVSEKHVRRRRIQAVGK